MPDPIQHLFADDGVFPNSRLPVLIYRAALSGAQAATRVVQPSGFEELFERNGWSSSWRNGLYSVPQSITRWWPSRSDSTPKIGERTSSAR